MEATNFNTILPELEIEPAEFPTTPLSCDAFFRDSAEMFGIGLDAIRGLIKIASDNMNSLYLAIPDGILKFGGLWLTMIEAKRLIIEEYIRKLNLLEDMLVSLREVFALLDLGTWDCDVVMTPLYYARKLRDDPVVQKCMPSIDWWISAAFGMVRLVHMGYSFEQVSSGWCLPRYQPRIGEDKPARHDEPQLVQVRIVSE